MASIRNFLSCFYTGRTCQSARCATLRQPYKCKAITLSVDRQALFSVSRVTSCTGRMELHRVQCPDCARQLAIPMHCQRLIHDGSVLSSHRKAAHGRPGATPAQALPGLFQRPWTGRKVRRPPLSPPLPSNCPVRVCHWSSRIRTSHRSARCRYRAAGLWRFGDVRFDERLLLLTVRGEPAEPGQKALRVLAELLRHAGEVVTRDELAESCWPRRIVSEAALLTTISRLRSSLGPDGAAVQTVKGYGYRLSGRSASRAPPRQHGHG